MSSAVLFVAFACRPADRAFPGPDGSFVVTPTALAIGPAPVGGAATGEIQVLADAAQAITVTAEVFGDGFDVIGGPWDLDADGQALLTAVFEPTGTTDATGTIVLSAAPGDGTSAVAVTGGLDLDWDGDGALHVEADGDDCDDDDPTVHPDADEVWYDGIDQDCDGNDNDQDRDGSPGADDCDDLDGARFPGAVELLDGTDQDCDGITDEVAPPETLLITEFFVAPSSVPPVYGQFLEVLNLGAKAVGLGGWTVTSEAASGVVSPTVSVPPGGLVVLCSTVDPELDGELPCDGTVVPWPTFSRKADTATLVADPEIDATYQDTVRWNESWLLTSGVARCLDPGAQDPATNDDAASWCDATSAWAQGDLGSPGLANVPCPGP